MSHNLHFFDWGVKLKGASMAQQMKSLFLTKFTISERASILYGGLDQKILFLSSSQTNSHTHEFSAPAMSIPKNLNKLQEIATLRRY